jgi:L-fuconolactonase
MADAPDVIDAHVHLWDPSRLSYPWLQGTALDRCFTATDLLADTPPGTRFVVVQADCVPSQGMAEVSWLAAQARRHPAIRGIVAFAPIELGAGAASFLRRLRREPHVVGVRRLLQDEPPGFGTTRGFLTGLTLLGELDLPFDVCVRAHQLGDVIELVRRTPGTLFVLDHLGKPTADRGGWSTELARLAQEPNVVCKLSGLASETGGRAPTTEHMRPALLSALDHFGPTRCLFGSDWPLVTETYSHQRWLHTVLEVLDGYGDGARHQVMSATAHRVYALTGGPSTR